MSNLILQFAFKKSFIYLALTFLVLVSISVEKVQAEDVYSENLIPPMDNFESAYGKSASSSHVTATPSWKAFDGKLDYKSEREWNSWTIGPTTGWLSYEFKTPKAISKYVIHNNGPSSAFPNTWTFEAWDGSKWVILDSQSNVTANDWLANPEQIFTFENSSHYNVYRVNITKNNGAAYGIGLVICELQMMEKISSPTEPDTKSITLDKNVLELLEGNQGNCHCFSRYFKCDLDKQR